MYVNSFNHLHFSYSNLKHIFLCVNIFLFKCSNSLKHSYPVAAKETAAQGTSAIAVLTYHTGS